MPTARLLDVLADRLPLVYSAALFLVVTFAAQYVFRKDPLSKIPFVASELGGEDKRRAAYLANAKSLYTDGYNKFKNSIFRITTTTDCNTITIPRMYLDFLKKQPDDVLTFDGAIDELFATHITKLNTGDPTIPHIVRGNLTSALPRINPVMTDEVTRTIRDEIRAGDDWTDININQTLLRIVAIISGRIFLGPELCHNETYIDAAINYTLELTHAREAIMKLRPWLRNFYGPSLPEVKKLYQREEEFDAVIRPVVEARLERERSDPSYVKPDDMLQWLMDAKLKDSKYLTDKSIVRGQLGLSFAAIHTTTMTTTHAFYDLAANPDLIAELREECFATLSKSGGVFSSSALQSMKKLDSCLKETLRMNPPGLGSFNRKVLKEFSLPNGQVVPAGSMIDVPNYPISRDSELFPDPDRYDGLRFYRMRDGPGTAGDGDKETKPGLGQTTAQNQFVNVSQSSLSFGYGRHACPGRFFAANEIKMIIARVIMDYEVKMPDGVQGRYPNWEFGGAIAPDPTKTLLFRAVKS